MLLLEVSIWRSNQLLYDDVIQLKLLDWGCK